MERLRAVVIGAGQAGLAASHEFTVRGVEHAVLDAGVIGQTWRTHRWRSFRLVSPNWLNRLPGYWYDGPDPHGFLDTAEMIAYLEGYAASFDAPVRTGVAVRSIVPDVDGFRLDTTLGSLLAGSVVVATGAFGAPRIPALAAQLPPGVVSIHTDAYWAPENLPPGGVLVVGAGQAGLQIADELARHGRRVWVAVGRHGWVPRRLYDFDQMHWRQEMGDFEAIVGNPDAPAAEYPFSPLARWGETDFNVRTVWQNGVAVIGHFEATDGTTLRFADDLHGHLRAGDEYARTYARRVRDFLRGRGEEAPEADLPSAWHDGEMPASPASLDIATEGVSTVIWATGYRQDFSWIRAPAALADNGAPYQRQGVSPVPGLYFVGLHRMWEGAAGTVLGCGWAASHVAEEIAGG